MSGPHDKKKPQGPQLAGVVGFFDDPGELIAATAKVRDQNYQYFDAFTPYPIHGLDAAQGLKRSPLPFVTFGAGLTGFCLAFLLQYWTSAVDWPLNVGGKPLNSWPAFVPILFELTVLLAGLATVGAMFIFNGMPNLRRRSFDSSITRDRFALMIEVPPVADEDDDEAVERLARKQAKYKKFTEAEAATFLKGVGAKEVRSVMSEGWFG
jgi:hypothetical protein